MANTQLPGVLVLDTVADPVTGFATGTQVRVSGASWTGASGASAATVGDAGFTTAKLAFSVSAANGSDVQFFDPPLVLSGIKVGVLASGAVRLFLT